jgi:hypothetical protein
MVAVWPASWARIERVRRIPARGHRCRCLERKRRGTPDRLLPRTPRRRADALARRCRCPRDSTLWPLGRVASTAWRKWPARNTSGPAAEWSLVLSVMWSRFLRSPRLSPEPPARNVPGADIDVGRPDYRSDCSPICPARVRPAIPVMRRHRCPVAAAGNPTVVESPDGGEGAEKLLLRRSSEGLRGAWHRDSITEAHREPDGLLPCG